MVPTKYHRINFRKKIFQNLTDGFHFYFEMLLIMSGKFGYLKDGSEESVNLQSTKNRIHNMIFSSCSQDAGDVTSWRLALISKFL